MAVTIEQVVNEKIAAFLLPCSLETKAANAIGESIMAIGIECPNRLTLLAALFIKLSTGYEATGRTLSDEALAHLAKTARLGNELIGEVGLPTEEDYKKMGIWVQCLHHNFCEIVEDRSSVLGELCAILIACTILRKEPSLMRVLIQLLVMCAISDDIGGLEQVIERFVEE